MNKGLFSVQINEVEGILKGLDLLKGRNNWPNYKDYAASFFRRHSYTEGWRFSFDNMLYDFILNDESLIQLKAQFDPLEISYAYLECPFKQPLTFVEFAGLQESSEEERDEFAIRRQYEFYIAVPDLKETFMPIRYDYSPLLYDEGRHPASHFHFGHKNEMRLGTKKVLRPLSFLFFVIRQRYPKLWSQFTDRADANVLCRNVRDHPPDVEMKYWNKKDDWEMFLV